MVEPDRAVWAEVLAHVRSHHPGICRQWFEDIAPAGFDGGVLYLRVEDEVRRGYLQRECVRQFSEAAQAVTNRLVAARFVGSDFVVPAARPVRVAARAATAADHPQSPADAPIDGATTPAAAPRRPTSADELALNPDYTFDNFVVGPNNRLAHAAAVAIAEKPGEAYNPLFIHGGVGLGKTHLMQAVCHRIREQFADWRILYISCEAFITRFMEAVQAGQMQGFRHHFRDVDVLMIDDVHFLAKRDRTQDEFFHTFNTLYQARRQIVLTSDAPPDQIPHLEDRLVSRFKWGLVAETDPPDFETRMAIVQQKARGRGVDVPDEVASLVAARIESNIRELEGALTRIQMQAHIAQREIDVEIARVALGVRSDGGKPRATIQTIVDAVTDFYSVSLSNLQSKRRHRSVALPRQVCMYLARQHTRYSLEEIGGYFGGRDHTTVLHAVRTIARQKDSDARLCDALSSIERRLATQDNPPA